MYNFVFVIYIFSILLYIKINYNNNFVLFLKNKNVSAYRKMFFFNEIYLLYIIIRKYEFVYLLQ